MKNKSSMKANMRGIRIFTSPFGNGSGSGCGYCVANPGRCRPPLWPLLLSPPPSPPDSCDPWARCKCRLYFHGSALSGPLSALIVWAPSAPSSSSSSPTGGSSWSCVHSPLKLLRKMLQILQILNGPTSQRRSPRLGAAPPGLTESDLRSCGLATGHTMERTPTLKRTAIRE